MNKIPAKKIVLYPLLAALGLFLFSVAVANPLYAGASAEKEELSLEMAPDLLKSPAQAPRQAPAEGIKAGVMEIQKEAALSEPEPAPKPEPTLRERLGSKLADANSLYTSGKYEDAIRLWEEALEIEPDDPGIKKNIIDAEAKIELKLAKKVKAASLQPVQAPKAAPATDLRIVKKPQHVTAQKPPLLNQIFSKEVGVKEIKSPGRPVIAVKKAMLGRLSLADCIDIAVANHIPLQVAQKSVKLARMRVTEARRNMLPSVMIDVDQYRGKVNGQNYTGRKQYIEGQQPVFHGGELYYTVKQAEVNQEITRTEYAKIKNELVLQVKKGYYTLAKSKDNLDLQRELAAAVERIYDMVKRQAEANIISRIEVLNVGSQKSQVGYQLASADGDVSVAELILKQAMNIDPNAGLDIVTDLRFRKIAVDYANALAAAYVNRPEMRINTLMIDYYNYGKKIAAAKGSLKIDLMGNWGLAKEEYAYPDSGPINDAVDANGNYINWYQDNKLEQQWYAGIKASVPFWGSTAEYSWTREAWVPVVSAYQGTQANTNSFKFKLFDRLDTFSEPQLAEIDFDRARQELNKIRQDVTLEVKEQCFNYQKALIQLETATSKIKFQERDLEYTKMKRGLDEVPDSNVIEGMIKMAQEKFGYVQALTDCHISVASINKAVGIEDYYKDEAGR